MNSILTGGAIFAGAKRPRQIPALLAMVGALLASYGVATLADAQSGEIRGPSRKDIFREDTEAERDLRKKEVRKVIRSTLPSADLAIKAPKTEYTKNQNEVKATGGAVISQGGLEAQADEALLNVETKDAKLDGRVVLTTPDLAMHADDAQLNLDTETGDFHDADFLIEQGQYGAEGGVVKKLSDTEFELTSSALSTCHCEDGSQPWKITSSRCHITRDSYAHTYNSLLTFHGVPLVYSPYLPFPVKEERTSGLLVPKYGYSDRDGVELTLPIFGVINDNADVLFTPFIESKTRRGASLEGRWVLSGYHNVDGKILYSDETPRDGNLRGTDISGVFDPEIEDDRLGGFYRQVRRPTPDDPLPITFVADVHLVNDDLFLREIEDDDIGEYNSRYTTSTLALRAPIGDYLTADLIGEYNQAFDQDPDLVFQRAPELDLAFSRSLRPFGLNPYGLKFVTSATASVTVFTREEGYEGTRLHTQPRVQVPFHYKNYLNGSLEAGVYQTNYSLSDAVIPQPPPSDPSAPPPADQLVDDNASRTLPYAGLQLGTGVERVYQVDPTGWLNDITSVGVQNQPFRLERLKHTVEPLVRYSYIPDEDQDPNPLFDSIDRIRERQLVTYGVKTRLLGRFYSPQGSELPITELTSEVDDLPVIDLDPALQDVDRSFGPVSKAQGLIRDGRIQELASLFIRQSYDYVEDKEDNDPEIHAFSDVGADLLLRPNTYFGFGLLTNYNTYDHKLSSWNLMTSFRDDRRDSLRLLYSFVDDSLSQVEGNLELTLSDRIRLGFYGRYDELESEFIEDRTVLRLLSACNCWSFDVSFVEKINPDRQAVLFTFTLSGLGDVTQNFFVPQDKKDTDSGL